MQVFNYSGPEFSPYGDEQLAPQSAGGPWPAPVARGPLAASIYRRFADEGGASLDFSAIINTIRNNSEGAAA